MNDRWQLASRLWSHMGQPLRPGPEDLRVITDWLPDAALSKPQLRVIVLGATPEYYALPWPADATVTAVDKSPTMLGAIWPGHSRICADWLALPLDAGSVDLVLCDGGLCLQQWPHGQQALVTALGRVLRPGALFILRCFAPPAEREAIGNVVDDLLAGRVTNRNQVRLRTWMALQQSVEEGVNNRVAWRALAEAEPNVERLAALMNVDVDYLRNVLANADNRMFHFAHTATVHSLFCERPGGFRLEEMRVPRYPYGAWCPTHVLRRN